MAELREFAQHKKDFNASNIELVAISTDDPIHARKVWETHAGKVWTVLMDPGTKAISAYGLLAGGTARRTVVLIDEQGREIYRRSTDGIDESKLPAEILAVAKGDKS